MKEGHKQKEITKKKERKADKEKIKSGHFAPQMSRPKPRLDFIKAMAISPRGKTSSTTGIIKKNF